MAKLILSMDGLVLKEIPLTKERTTIGRKPHNDIQIDNLAVSGEHAVIVTILNDSFLEDLGSTNGTVVNGNPIKKHFLQNNDVVELGKYKLKFVGEPAAAVGAEKADFEKTMVLRPAAMKAAAEQARAMTGSSAPQQAAGAARASASQQAVASATAAGIADKDPRPAPPPAARPAQPLGAIQLLSGANAGKELELSKPLTTLGKPGVGVAVLTRRPQGYFITHVDNIIYDTRLRVTMPRGVDPRIVILDIDEKSLGEIGRWPWSRRLMAELVDKLFDKYGVGVLGFDVIWAERDTSSGIDVLDSLAQKDLNEVPAFQQVYRGLREKLDNDGLFAASIRSRPVVLGYYFTAEDNAVRANAIPDPVIPKGTFAGRNISFLQWKGYTGNLPIYQNHAAAAGHFNPKVDDDGVSRRVPMLLEFEDAYYEPLSLAMVRTYLALTTGKFPEVEPGFAPERFVSRGYGGLEWLKVGPLTIPVDETASALIPYRGHKFSFPYLSLTDVIKDRIMPDALKGKIALIGTTAPGLQDLRSTPVDSVFPGVEIHANLIAGMLDRDLKQKPPYMLGAEVVLLIIGAE